MLRSTLSNLSEVEPFLMKVNRLLKLDEVQFNKLYLATTEAITNGIIHGNKQNPGKKVTITCEVNKKSVVVRVSDEGGGYDLRRTPNPLLKKNILKENGRGIFLMRTLMDDVKSTRTPKGLEVVLKMGLRKN